VRLSALIVIDRRDSRRACLASRSWRSRLTSANSDATKSPVPIVRTSPVASMINSYTATTNWAARGRVVHYSTEYSWRPSPRDGQRLALFITRGRLDAHKRVLVELREGARPGVGE